MEQQKVVEDMDMLLKWLCETATHRKAGEAHLEWRQEGGVCTVVRVYCVRTGHPKVIKVPVSEELVLDALDRDYILELEGASKEGQEEHIFQITEAGKQALLDLSHGHTK